ncbi:hypothetical protein GCM10007036_16660 [Alsobacter metallidurans]|uniref:Uncharacterized protein n=1 Tax=Alsobacter metallidurans TaxID=340221 RepID=A0A917I5W6_9HYPH|nr:hypothetical protein [Alsobacter metallidurans]GGH16174.1 hypothetical protein GCM10007036_16660 [Alsobacter metallidurans]
MAKLEIQISAAPDHATLSFQAEGSTLAIQLDATDLDQLIYKLAKARAHLADGVPLQLEPVAIIEAVADPNWRVNRPIEGGFRPLLLRHPGFGWIGYALSQQSAAALVEQLTDEPEELREAVPTTPKRHFAERPPRGASRPIQAQKTARRHNEAQQEMRLSHVGRNEPK